MSNGTGIPIMTRIDHPLPGRPATLAKRRRRLVALAAVFMGSALAVGLLGAGSLSAGLGPHALGTTFDVAAALLGLLLGILIWLWAHWRGKFDLFEPPIWISLNLYVQVVANVWLLQRDKPSTIRWLIDNPGMYSQAVVLFGLGLSALWLGYALTFHALGKSRRFQSAPQPTPRIGIAAAVWLAGTAIAIISVLFGTSTYLGRNVGSTLSNYLFFVDLTTKTAAAVLIIEHFRHPTRAGRWWLVAVVVLSIVIGLFSGSKVFLLDILWLIMLIYYARGSIPARWPTLLLVAFIFLVPVVNTYRTVLYRFDVGTGVGTSDRVVALGEALTTSVTQPLGSAVDASRDTFERRQGSIMHLTASALYLHPNIIPLMGDQMAEFLPAQLIPRVLWPVKPNMPDALMYKTTIYTGAPFETSLSTLGQFADSYRAGGWIGTFAWLLVIGVFSGWLYVQGPYRRSFPGTVFFVTVLSQILRYDKEMLLTIIQLLQFATLLWILINWGLFVPARRRRAEAAALAVPSSHAAPVEGG